MKAVRYLDVQDGLLPMSGNACWGVLILWAVMMFGSWGAAEGKGEGLATAMLGAIGEPEPEEFGDPVATVRHLVGAIKDQDLEEYLKCFPVRQELEKSTLEALVTDLGMYSPEAVPRLPGDRYFNLQAILRDKVAGYYQFTFGFLLDTSGGLERIDPSALAGKKRIAEIHRMLDQGRLGKLEIQEIRVKDLPAHIPMPSKLKRLGAEDFRYVNAKASLEGNELGLLVVVGRFGDQWRVQSVMHNPGL